MALLHAAAFFLSTGFFQVLGARGKGRVGEVREQAVHADAEELQVFIGRVTGHVKRQAAFLVAEGERVHQQPQPMAVTFLLLPKI